MTRTFRPSIRAFLLAFSVAILVPVLGFASVLLWRFAESQSARYGQEARAAAQRIMAAVDLELSKMQVAAESLATSPHLASGDFEAFHRQALDALRVWSPADPNKMAVVVRDLSGRQLANTRVSWGQPLPKGSLPEVDKVIAETRRPSIQGLFVGATAGRPIVSIRVPVFTGAEVTHVLSMALEPERFLDLILAQKLPGDWTGAVVDRADRVIARFPEHVRFVGTLAPEEFRTTATGDSGLWTGKNLDGVRVLGAYERSSLSGWRSFAGVPLTTADRPVRRSLWFIAALGLSAIALSSALAVLLGQRIATSVRELASAARRLGQGQAVAPAASGLRELDEVGDVLAQASTDLHEREAALKASEGRLLATHENAAVGIVEVDRNGRFLYVNEAQCRLTGHTREELLGRHFAHATHPDDLDRDYDLFRRQVAGEFAIYTLEKQHVRLDGTTGWARVSSTAVRDPDGAFLYAVRVVEDITERKQAEARQKLLVDELNHRVKNTLATVQSLAVQTFRQALPPEIARERFEARLLSLSRTHNLLNESSWVGASLKDVLAMEVEPYVADARERLVAEGPDIDLPPRLAVVLGMIFHELATNAAKYGALSVPSGKVEVNWRVAQARPGAELLRIEWMEQDGPSVTEPIARGFGSRLIEKATRHELNGNAELVFEPAGLTCRLEIPLQERPLPTEFRDAA
jgi:PAS domain S-box-containing protein